MSGAEPAIMVAEGSSPRYAWRQYLVITDRRLVIVEMVPALFGGWKFQRVTVQGAEDWPGGRDSIVAWKLANAYPPAMAGDLGEFRAKLVAVAESGRLPERAA